MLYLGIETGATHTTVMLTDGQMEMRDRFNLGPANVRLVPDQVLTRLFRSIKARTGAVSSIAAGMSGVRNAGDHARILALARAVWPETPVLITNDLETPLEAAGAWPDKVEARVLLLSGTGSCAYGRDRCAKVVKFGGRGHILGDQGSACDIALRTLRAIAYQEDVQAQFPALGQAVLRALQFNHPDDLIPWTQVAEKHEIAYLAVIVFEEARKGDRLAQEVLRQAAESLADMAAHCAEHLVKRSAAVQFMLAGSTLLQQPSFAAAVSKRLHDRWPECRVDRLKRESVWGAVELARRHLAQEGGVDSSHEDANLPEDRHPEIEEEIVSLACLAESPTERRNPKSMNFDTMSIDEGIELMVAENALAVEAVLQQKEGLRWLVEQTIAAFQAGRRLYYVGAGTSGRLGVLDASECPPTFRVSPDQVQSIMAGGQRAIWSAVEGAEDNSEAGGNAVVSRGVSKGDVVLGIAASGRTPYVWGALHRAKKLGATTALLAFHPTLQVKPEHQPDLMILVDTGPEVLTGSTRLKAGTATKVILNTLTTLAMVHTGKVLSNLMVDLNASNVKLRDRAIRLVRELVACDAAQAKAALEASGWGVKAAVALLQKQSTAG